MEGTADPILHSAHTATLSLLSFWEELRCSDYLSITTQGADRHSPLRSPHIWRRELSRRLVTLLRFPPKLPLGAPGAPPGHRRKENQVPSSWLETNTCDISLGSCWPSWPGVRTVLTAKDVGSHVGETLSGLVGGGFKPPPPTPSRKAVLSSEFQMVTPRVVPTLSRRGVCVCVGRQGGDGLG